MYRIQTDIYSHLEDEGVSSRLLKKIDNLIYQQYDYFHDHSDNIDKYMRVFAEKVKEECPELQWNSLHVEALCLGTLVHDIGKLSIPLKLLTKKESFTKNDYKAVQIHPKSGKDMLDKVREEMSELSVFDRLLLDIITDMTIYHHERLNGLGYYGMTKDNLSLEAKMMSIVDSFDAMTTKRCYKSAIGQRAAIDRLKELEDFYDIKLVEIFEKSIFIENCTNKEVEKNEI